MSQVPVEIAEKISHIRELFQTTGWKTLQADWIEDIKSIERQIIGTAKNFEEVAAARGALNVLQRLVHLDVALEQVERSFEAQEEDE